MKPLALVPPEMQAAIDLMKMSPGLLSHHHVFLSGMTGAGPDGAMPDDSETQFRQVFAKIEAILAQAGLDLSDVVEMTSYHIGLREHFNLFQSIRVALLTEPYPAWTAVEVAGLRRVGAIVEVRVVAALRAT